MTPDDRNHEANAVLLALVAGGTTPEQAATELWTIADRDVGRRFPLLYEFRELAITWSVLEDYEAECDFDREAWREELTALADAVLAHGGVSTRLNLNGPELCLRPERVDRAPERPPATMTRQSLSRSPRPLCLLDIDGVLALLGDVNDELTFETIVAGLPVTIAAAASKRLRLLADHFDLVWASAWMRTGAEQLAPLLGLPDDLPFIRLDLAADDRSGNYKLGPVRSFVRDRPCAWVDDELGVDVLAWAETRQTPTLLVPTDPQVGLTDENINTLTGFAAHARS